MKNHEFLTAHPTPWRYEETAYQEEGKGVAGVGRIVDANDHYVVGSADVDGYESGLYGEVEELIAFINEIGSGDLHWDHPDRES